MYGYPDKFREIADKLGLKILAEMPVVPDVSAGGDKGIPSILLPSAFVESEPDAVKTNLQQWNEEMNRVAAKVWDTIS